MLLLPLYLAYGAMLYRYNQTNSNHTVKVEFHSLEPPEIQVAASLTDVARHWEVEPGYAPTTSVYKLIKRLSEWPISPIFGLLFKTNKKTVCKKVLKARFLGLEFKEKKNFCLGRDLDSGPRAQQLSALLTVLPRLPIVQLNQG